LNNTILIAPDFEWDRPAGQGRILVRLAGTVVAVHAQSYNAGGGGGSCSVGPLAGTGASPPWILLGLCGLLVVAGGLRRRPRGARLRPAVAAATAGVFVVWVSVPRPFGCGGVPEARAALPGVVTYHHGDPLGSAIVVTNADASTAEQVTYRPYGARVEGTEPPEFGFTGQRYLAQTGVYHFGARAYDPGLGRFLQPDPLVPDPFNPQALNRYSYVVNDPLNKADPTGLQFEEPPAFGAGFDLRFAYRDAVAIEHLQREAVAYQSIPGHRFDFGGSHITFSSGNSSAQVGTGNTVNARTVSGSKARGQSQSGVGVQVAGGNELTDAQALQQAQQLRHGLVMDPRHPLAQTGFGDNRSLQTEALIEAYGEAYAETVLGVAGGPAARGATTAARGALNSGRFLTATEAAGGAAFGFNEGFNFGVPGGGQGNPFSTPRVGSTPFIVGRAVGRAAGVGTGFVVRSGERIGQFLTGLSGF